MKCEFSFFALPFLLLSCGETTIENISGNSSDTTQTITDTVVQNTIDLPEPAGWVLAERFASDDNEYIFCEDGKIIFDNHAMTKMEGTWELKGDSIVITYTQKIVQIGVGDPLPMPEAVPGNYVTEYESYEEKIESITESQILFLSEIKEFLSQDSLYPYEIMERNFKCD